MRQGGGVRARISASTRADFRFNSGGHDQCAACIGFGAACAAASSLTMSGIENHWGADR